MSETTAVPGNNNIIKEVINNWGTGEGAGRLADTQFLTLVHSSVKHSNSAEDSDKSPNSVEEASDVMAKVKIFSLFSFQIITVFH